MSSLSSSTFAQVTLGLNIAAVIVVGFFGLWQAKKFLREVQTNEAFVTGEGKASLGMIAWSFYASVVGGYVVATTPWTAWWQGIIGVVAYAMSPMLLLTTTALLGNLIRKERPDTLSLTDYFYFRFGRITQLLFMTISVFSSAISMCAEYSVLVSIYADYIGLNSGGWTMAVFIGLVTLSYTTLGGVATSIATDQIQGVASVALIAVLTVYLLATYRVPGGVYQPDKLTPEENDQFLGTTVQGWSSILTIPGPFTSWLFLESYWQRVWASESPRAALMGSMIASVMSFVVLFLVGFTGVLAGWAGIYSENPNLWFFYLLKPLDEEFQPLVSNVAGVLTVLATTLMIMGFVDSAENGISSTVNSVLQEKFPSHSLALARTLVVVLNVPVIIVGSLKINAMSLYLLIGILSCGAVFPIMLGVSRHPFLRTNLTDSIPITAFLISQAAAVGYSYSVVVDSTLSIGANLAAAFDLAYISNGYLWEYMLIPLTVSIGTTVILVTVRGCFGSAQTECKEDPQVVDKEEDQEDKGTVARSNLRTA